MRDICSEVEREVISHLPEILHLRQTGKLKPDNTYVSQGDLLCQQLLFDCIRRQIPSCEIISEESDFSRISYDKDFIITVDPIDGTENFISGLKEWGVGISIYYKGSHFQSMILLPELGISLKSGDKIEKVRSSRICGLSSYMTPKDFEDLNKDFEYRIMGCCMYNMYNVIKGSYAMFQHLKGCYSWDILPGLNLALEHGLSVDIDGVPYKGEFLHPGVKYRFKVYYS